tara:strand:- start:3064 stop:4413 length:1350 start_codon:yes stop_codon:yes gene_type:complete
MKIAIVGAGIAGITQLQMLSGIRGSYEKDDEIVLIHDPDKVYPFFLSSVGNTLLGGYSEQSNFNCTRSFAIKHLGATDYYGTKFIGWGNRTDKNFVLSQDGGSGGGLHLDIEKLRNYIINDGGKCFGENISVLQQTIDKFDIKENTFNINGVEYDIVIDCTEKQPLFAPDDYGTPIISPSNSTLVAEIPLKGNWDFTIEYAAKYGHITGIPLADKQYWAYHYDNSVDVDDIRNDFVSIFGEGLISKYHELDYTPKISNYIIHPEYSSYFRNGNTAYLTETLGFMQNEMEERLAENISEYIYNNGDQDLGTVLNNFGEIIMEMVLPTISFCFQYGSRWDTDYWTKCKEQAINHLEMPFFKHPQYESEWRDNILTDKWGDKEYKKLLNKCYNHALPESSEYTNIPYFIMMYYTWFYELATGLGASYADKFDTFDMIYPPEKHGEIGYKLYE